MVRERADGQAPATGVPGERHDAALRGAEPGGEPGRDLGRNLGRRMRRARLFAWLPEGRPLPDAVWARRHQLIVRYALLQAVGVGAYGLLRGFAPLICALDVVLIGAPALLACLSSVGRRTRTISATVSLMFACATIVDLSGGVTESHFSFFVMLGVVALYQDWVAFGVCIVIVLLHHAVLGTIDPSAVYGSTGERLHPVFWAFVHGAFILAASVAHLIAWRANERQMLADPLTRLMNRAAFAEDLGRALAESRSPVSVVVVDLDNFKQINELVGLEAGDEVLRNVARRLAASVRQGDGVARIGGNEFAALVHGDASVATSVAHRLNERLQEPFVVRGRSVAVRASIGVADSELARSRIAEDLIRDADLAMYLAKRSGKGGVFTYTAGVDRAVRQRAELANDLRSAVESGELDVYYQPVVRGVDARLVGVEALLRWHHPTRGLVPPDEFVPLAEESGQIREIGAWVLRTAAAQVVAWQRSVPDCANLRLAVNLSAVQLRADGLVDVVRAALEVSSLRPRSLTLEVTETSLLVDVELARNQLDAIRALGVRVAIDDFGTGYSSLSYLSTLPVDVIKIDRSFVCSLEHQAGSAVLVQAVIDMAAALGLDVVAEGVEHRNQQQVLNELGCGFSQGYLYSPALLGQMLETLARRWRQHVDPLVATLRTVSRDSAATDERGDAVPGSGSGVARSAGPGSGAGVARV